MSVNSDEATPFVEHLKLTLKVLDALMDEDDLADEEVFTDDEDGFTEEDGL
jgi:hypothetical protein